MSNTDPNALQRNEHIERGRDAAIRLITAIEDGLQATIRIMKEAETEYEVALEKANAERAALLRNADREFDFASANYRYAIALVEKWRDDAHAAGQYVDVGVRMDALGAPLEECCETTVLDRNYVGRALNSCGSLRTALETRTIEERQAREREIQAREQEICDRNEKLERDAAERLAAANVPTTELVLKFMCDFARGIRPKEFPRLLNRISAEITEEGLSSVRISIGTLARYIGRSRSAVMLATGLLEKAGAIGVSRRDPKTGIKTYTLHT